MTQHTTNTNPVRLFPEANYTLTVSKVFAKTTKNGFDGYQWEFETMVSGVNAPFKLFMFANQMGDLLRALGAQEINPDEFAWNDQDMQGKVINCNIVHEVDKQGRKREKMIDIKLVDVDEWK